MSIAMSLLSAEMGEVADVSTLEQSDEMDLLEYEDLMERQQQYEESSQLVDEISQLMDDYPDIENMSMEQLEDVASPQLMSLLAYDDPMSLEEAEVGGVSRIFNRLWNVYYTGIANQYDWITDLFKNNKKMLVKYKSRMLDAKQRFDSESKDWTNGVQITSYVNLYNYYFTEKGWVRSPIDQLKKESELNGYVLDTYPKQVEKLIRDFTSSAKRLDVSKGTFVEDAYKVARGMVHPAYVFDKKYLGGRPYMMNVGFHVLGKKPKSDDQLKHLASPRKVASTKILTHFTGKANVSMEEQIIPDVKMSVSDLGKFIDGGLKLIDDVDKYYNGNKSPEAILKEMKGVVENIQNSGANAPKTAQTAARQLVRYSKNLIDCYYSPATKRAKQTLEVSKAVARLAGRFMSGAK